MDSVRRSSACSPQAGTNSLPSVQSELTERTLCQSIVDPEGLEPPTPWFEAKCSIQLSYGSMIVVGETTGADSSYAEVTVRFADVKASATEGAALCRKKV